MKKILIILLSLLILFTASSCSSNISQKAFISIARKEEEKLLSYEVLPKTSPDISYSFRIYNDVYYEPILFYSFYINDFMMTDENRYHVSVTTVKTEASYYEYYVDTSTYIKRFYENDYYYDSEEFPIEYEAFYRNYVKIKYHSTLPDFNELKEYTFINHHTFTPSATATITFNEDYHYQFIEDDILVDISNLEGEVNFHAPNGWKIFDISLKGIDDSNKEYQLQWYFS